MNVKGNHDFNVSREKLWSYLMDPEVLAKITPGVTKLKTIDTDTYQSISDIKIGPVKGSFKGKLNVQDTNEPASFVIKMEQLSKIGNAHATIQMELADKGANQSALSFDGKAKLSGVIARTGQRVLSGVANKLTKEVFAALEQHIEENQEDVADKDKTLVEETISTPPPVETPQDNTNVVEVQEIAIEPTPIAQQTQTPTQDNTSMFSAFINSIKRLFGMN